MKFSRSSSILNLHAELVCYSTFDAYPYLQMSLTGRVSSLCEDITVTGYVQLSPKNLNPLLAHGDGVKRCDDDVALEGPNMKPFYAFSLLTEEWIITDKPGSLTLMDIALSVWSFKTGDVVDPKNMTWEGSLAGKMSVSISGGIPVFLKTANIAAEMDFAYSKSNGLSLHPVYGSFNVEVELGDTANSLPFVSIDVNGTFAYPCQPEHGLKASALVNIHIPRLLTVDDLSVDVHADCDVPAGSPILVVHSDATDGPPVSMWTPLFSAELIKIDLDYYGSMNLNGRVFACLLSPSPPLTFFFFFIANPFLQKLYRDGLLRVEVFCSF